MDRGFLHKQKIGRWPLFEVRFTFAKITESSQKKVNLKNSVAKAA